MKTIVALAAALFMMACSPSQPPPPNASMPTQEAAPAKAPPAAVIAGYSVSGPYTHANLTVFLLHSPGVAKDTATYLTLEEALKAKTLQVTEKGEGGEVNTLQVENTGDQPVFLQAGDTVKGGKQDRTIAVDMLLQPKSAKQDIAAFCVEPGRWAARGGAGEARYANVFGVASAPVASKEQKLAVKLSQDQNKVWDEGRKVQKGLADNAELKESRGRVTGAASYVVTSELPEVEKQTQAYVEALLKVAQGKADAVGMAYTVNGEASTMEVYSSPGLFQKLWAKLLKGAAVEAFSKKSDAVPAREGTADDIKVFLTRASDGKTTSKDLPQDVRLETVDAAKTAIFETRVKGELLHRQVMTK